VDSDGFLAERADDALLDATDLVLLDLKSADRATYRRVTKTGELNGVTAPADAGPAATAAGPNVLFRPGSPVTAGGATDPGHARPP
jgi:hypothetical protein